MAGRLIDDATRFYVCPSKSNCAVNETSGAVTCMQNSAGVLCALCTPGYTSGSAAESGSGCSECPSSVIEVLWPWLLVATLVIAVALVWFKGGGREWWEDFRRRVLNGRDMGLVVLFKLGTGFFQVVLLQPAVYDVRFPQLYLDFLAQFKFLKFGLPFQSFVCFIPTNYHDRVYSATALSTTILAALGMGIARSGHSHGCLLSLFIVPSYLLYPSISALFFQTFNCREIDQSRFLTPDLSINCDSSEHARAEGVARLMIGAFSIGLPAIYQALLYPHRHQLASSLSHEGTGGSGSFRMFKFLYDDYKPQYYWWEALEIVRKLLLTGVLVQFQKGSLIQTVMAIVIIVLHMLLLAHFKPYKRPRDGAVSLFVYAMLLAVFFGALLLSAQAALPEEHVLRRGISTTTVAVVLIFSVLSVFFVAVVIAVDEVRVAATSPVLQHAGSKRPVVFEHYRDEARFHLFLSHVWSSGQDQVLAIKKELLLLVPSLKIWLDVENLQDISKLEDNITSIDKMLLFMSKGYFKSWNCLREVRHATFLHSIGMDGIPESSSSTAAAVAEHRRKDGIPKGGCLILVREAEEQLHGGAPVKTLLAECPQRIGCGVHVLTFDAGCQDCASCSVDIQAALTAHAKSPAGVIDWIRFSDFKMVSLKLIVQQMLTAGGSGEHQLSIPGELTSRKITWPMEPCTRVLLHSNCYLSEQLPELLTQAVPGMDIELMGDGLAAVPTGAVTAVLLVVVHDGCWTDSRTIASVRFALENKITVVLLHEADADHSGCDFGTIMGQTPPGLKQIKGHKDAKLFDPIAVQWSRGAHQPVSVRLLALSLGASAEKSARWKSACRALARARIACAGIRSRGAQPSDAGQNHLSGEPEPKDDWAGAFTLANEGGTDPASPTSCSNPMHPGAKVSKRQASEDEGVPSGGALI
jgi:hypothetical protein